MRPISSHSFARDFFSSARGSGGSPLSDLMGREAAPISGCTRGSSAPQSSAAWVSISVSRSGSQAVPKQVNRAKSELDPLNFAGSDVPQLALPVDSHSSRGSDSASLGNFSPIRESRSAPNPNRKLQRKQHPIPPFLRIPLLDRVKIVPLPPGDPDSSEATS
jgi:hypothetical protein